MVQQYMKIGMPEEAAKFMTWLEVNTSKGDENRTDDAVERITGRRPQNLDAWIQENKAAWQ